MNIIKKLSKLDLVVIDFDKYLLINIIIIIY